ncbi:SDR family oxidoreductase [Cytobacillus oceanisediminis]|uniref:SDR family oxidoreductase n=1 Tax=Niallia alba TaxID=2729105 RepID=A0A7Y0K918_9BACI|nr:MULTISPECIES: SDR family oxidoreductase [Bacillaceae]EOR26243.1 3-ketoacyl-(acyl-carrier-protein) reductase [Niallia nealsonii AAU1]MBQ6447052.1 SDR family oxidoreductase [Bacillus sp. (in: firmicutes)]MBZ9532640.1 SDR family oxidoreductase [Cytobacillus oceanisediminis]NMO77415.1 SDR family oxidoreductase [Niallia alba]
MGKWILITGASGGIGQAIAKQLAKEGYSLYLHYHQNETAIKQLLESLSAYDGEYLPIQADLQQENDYKKIVENIFTIDGIIHASGISTYGLFTDLKEEEMKALWNIHVHSLMCITKAILPKMLSRQSGNIIVITSIWGQVGAAMEVAYSAVKGAQISFVKALSKELAYNGIRVNAVAPGAIKTNMLHTFSPEEMQLITEEIPMGRLGSPREVAESVAFLLSEKSSYMTGQILSLNGGWYV